MTQIIVNLLALLALALYGRKRMSEISDKVDAVLAEVTAVKGVAQSAVTLIQQLHDLLGAPGDPVLLDKLEQARALAATTETDLTAAISANQP